METIHLPRNVTRFIQSCFKHFTFSWILDVCHFYILRWSEQHSIRLHQQIINTHRPEMLVYFDCVRRQMFWGFWFPFIKTIEFNAESTVTQGESDLPYIGQGNTTRWTSEQNGLWSVSIRSCSSSNIQKSVAVVSSVSNRLSVSQCQWPSRGVNDGQWQPNVDRQHEMKCTGRSEVCLSLIDSDWFKLQQCT